MAINIATKSVINMSIYYKFDRNKLQAHNINQVKRIIFLISLFVDVSIIRNGVRANEYN
jgi:hypothetical protein